MPAKAKATAKDIKSTRSGAAASSSSSSNSAALAAVALPSSAPIATATLPPAAASSTSSASASSTSTVDIKALVMPTTNIIFSKMAQQNALRQTNTHAEITKHMTEWVTKYCVPVFNIQDANLNALFTKAVAGAGDPMAQYKIARALLKLYPETEEYDIQQDEKKAIYWIELAALGGEPLAQNHLAVCHHVGIGGLPANPAKALAWYQYAAARGNKIARFNLGEACRVGDPRLGITLNLILAEQYLTAALQQNHVAAAESLFMLATDYEAKGNAAKSKALLDMITAHVPAMKKWLSENCAPIKDGKDDKAIDGLFSQAKEGNLIAQCELGKRLSYQKDRALLRANSYIFGVKEEQYNAVQWFRFAAIQGHAYSQYIMGKFYWEGNLSGSVEQELDKAEFFLLPLLKNLTFTKLAQETLDQIASYYQRVGSYYQNLWYTNAASELLKKLQQFRQQTATAASLIGSASGNPAVSSAASSSSSSATAAASTAAAHRFTR